METIILGQPAKFKLGLNDTNTQQPVQGEYSDTQFAISDPTIISASVDADPNFFNVDTHALGDVTFTVGTTAAFSGVSAIESKTFPIRVIPEPPAVELTVTRV